MTSRKGRARSLAHRMARWIRYLFARRVVVDPGTVLTFSGDPVRRTTVYTTNEKGEQA